MELTILIADLPVTLILDEVEPVARARVLEWYTNFVIPACPARVTIRIHTEPGEAFIPLGTGPTYVIRSTHTDGRITFESHFERGWADLRAGYGELTMRPISEPENFLRVLYAWLCLEQGSLLLHASGVIRHERGYVFFGASGSGKTTISRLSAPATVLSDDMVIVRKYGDTFRACGVPFRGDFIEAPRTNAVADLRGVYRLIKASAHRIESVPTAEAVARLAACVPFVMRQPEHIARVMRVCNDLVAHVPVQALSFRRDPDFWKVIDGSV